MNIAFVVFDRMTSLDLIGFYDPVTRLRSMGILEGLHWDICALRPEVVDDRGMTFRATAQGDSLSAYEMVFVPGGFGTRALQYDEEFISWLGTAESAPLKVSVCTGALLFGAAGFLVDKPATTHPRAFDELAQYCPSVVSRRVVDAGSVITGGGVSASIDTGLHVVGRLASADAAAQIARQMDYPYFSSHARGGPDHGV